MNAPAFHSCCPSNGTWTECLTRWRGGVVNASLGASASGPVSGAEAVGELGSSEAEEARGGREISARPIHCYLVGRPFQLQERQAAFLEQPVKQRSQLAVTSRGC